jgi:putative DNA primase/helicase
MSNLSDFHGAMIDHDLQPPEFIEPGRFHRFPGQGKRRGNRAGWCVFFHDGTGGSFGDWSTGLIENWQAQRETPYTASERAEFRRRVMAAKAAEKAARIDQQSKAADKAADIINVSKPAVFHPYLQCKKVLPLGILENDNNLVIPMQDIDGKVWSVQRIDAAGKKLFMAGGRIKGCFYLIGGPVTDQVFICEGFATGASLHMYGDTIGTRGQPIVVAFTAGNLKSVALTFWKKYPTIKITIAADNDHKTPGNPGLTKAREAGALVGGNYTWPNFDDIAGEGSDFNDYQLAGGAL